MGLAASQGADVFELFSWAVRIRERFRGEGVDLCSIVSAKTGACPEDCAYCAQSARSKAQVPVTPLLPQEEVVERAFDTLLCLAERGKIQIAYAKPLTMAAVRQVHLQQKKRKSG